MMQVVDTNLEAVADQPLAKLFGNLVRTFWNKVEGGSKPQPHFQLGEFSNAVEANLGFYIMGKDDGKFLFLRPARPVFRWALRSWHNGPDIRNTVS